jgi:hypothetical protein
LMATRRLPQVLRQEHGSHAAAPDGALDAVALCERRLEPWQEVMHRVATSLGGAAAIS